jgi:hypothetical protein
LSKCQGQHWLCYTHLTGHISRYGSLKEILAAFPIPEIPEDAPYFGEHWIGNTNGVYCTTTWSVEIACACHPLPSGHRRARVTEHLNKGEKFWDLIDYCAAEQMPTAATDEGGRIFHISTLNSDRFFGDEKPTICDPEIRSKWKQSIPANEMAEFDFHIHEDRQQAVVSNSRGFRETFTVSTDFRPWSTQTARSRHDCRTFSHPIPPLPVCPRNHTLLYRLPPADKKCDKCRLPFQWKPSISQCARGCYICDYDLCPPCFNSPVQSSALSAATSSSSSS